MCFRWKNAWVHFFIIRCPTDVSVNSLKREWGQRRLHECISILRSIGQYVSDIKNRIRTSRESKREEVDRNVNRCVFTLWRLRGPRASISSFINFIADVIASQRINFKFRMTYACEYLRLLIVLIRACTRAYHPRYFVIDIATAHHNPIQINGMTKMSSCAQQFQNNLMNGATQSGHDHIKGVQRTVFLSLCILSPTDQQLKLNSHRELFEYSYFVEAKTHGVVTIFDFFFFWLSDSESFLT